MNNQDPACPRPSTRRANKALPDIVEACNVPTGKTVFQPPLLSMAKRLAASWSAQKNTPNLAKAGDGALCAIGVTMLGAALLAYFGVI